MSHEVNGSMIKIEGPQGPFDAYFAPALAEKGPGVIVLQEYWGLVEHIKDVCDRLAHSGFTALAPDLYQGKSTTEPDEAGHLMMALNIAETEVILRSAVESLLSSEHTTGERIGIVGFCMGGQLALFAAGENPKIVATVDFYGIHPKVTPNYAAIQGHVLGIFAENDTHTTPDQVQELDRRLDEAAVPHEFKTFANMPHAFFNDTRPSVYDAEAAQQAWEMLIAFFSENLV